MSFN
ncbi:aa98bbee-3f84-4e4d-bc58-4237f6e10678 [Thermothielavioides terrestris]|jgi:predicted RNase H-like HicB family nuclease